jgi:hypothetical protein
VVRSWKKLDAAGRLLLSINAALALLVYVEMDLTPADPLASAVAMPSPDLRNVMPQDRGAGFTMPPLEEYGEVVARPPLSPSRRPPSHAPASESAAGPVAFALVGIVLTGNERRVLIEHGDPPRLTRLGEGQEIDGWTIEAILRDRIVMGRSETRAELKLKDRPQSKTASARSAKGRAPQPLQESRHSPVGREQPAALSAEPDRSVSEQSPAAFPEAARASSGLQRRGTTIK